MSGGSMDYLYRKIEDAEFELNTPERIAFKKHLQLVANACKAIEWVDCGDNSEGSETESILNCINNLSVDCLCEFIKYISPCEIDNISFLKQNNITVEYKYIAYITTYGDHISHRYLKDEDGQYILFNYTDKDRARVGLSCKDNEEYEFELYQRIVKINNQVMKVIT